MATKVYMEGIDISAWQGNIDLSKYKNQFVIIRIGYSTTLDSKAKRNMDLCEKLGIPYGVYLYSYALSVSDAKEEAEFVLKQIKGRKISVGVWFDMEDADKYKKKHGFTFSKSNISNICNAFCKKIQDAGYYTGIYASQSWLDSYIDCKQYDKWCASWGSNNGKRNNDMSKYGTLHQYTSKPLDKSVMYAPLSTYDLSKKKPAATPAADTKPAQPSTGTTTEKAAITVPSLTLKKSTQEVIDDAIAWAKWIAGDKRFGYGRMGGSKYTGTTAYSITHSGGCHFCGTNAKKISRAKAAKLDNPEEWEYTFVCNTLTHAAYAHAGVQSMLKNGNHSWWTSTYQKSKNWEEVKKPAKVTDLKPGDICASDTHFAMYIGGGKGIQATSRGDVRTGTTEWQKSISTFDFADFFKRSKHVFRYVGTVNAETPIKYGEVGKRVKQWQAVINKLNGRKIIQEDGLFGDETLKQTMHLQAVLKVEADGIVGKNTLAAAAKALKPTPAPTPAVDYDKLAQEILDGKWGSGETRKKKLEAAGYDYDKVQAKVNELVKYDKIAKEVISGKWGNGDSRKKKLIAAGYDYDKVQKRVNTLVAAQQKVLAACKAQADWMKNYVYEYESNPTIEKSKKKGTCVTYVSCVCQRTGHLKSGTALWCDGKGYGTGHIRGASSKMDVIYMNNKTLAACRSELLPGDVVCVDDNKSGKSGNGGHFFIVTGEWSKDGDPYIWDNQSANRVRQGKAGKHTYSKSRKVLAIIRLK